MHVSSAAARSLRSARASIGAGAGLAALLVAPGLACAHGVRGVAIDGALPAVDGWSLSIVVLIAASGLAYALGAHRLALHRACLRGPEAPRRHHFLEGLWFAGGLFVMAAALLGPLEDWTDRSFAAHMLQHELLMLVAAPMLVVGRPLARFAWSFPAASRRHMRQRLARLRAAIGWRVFTSAAGACAVQAVGLFAWHVPAWFRAATVNPGLHALQHSTFVVTALCFWWTVLRPGPPRRVAAPALASLFVTTLATGALGALLTFTTHLWYALPGFAPPWGMSLVDDQQLGGLLMWVPGGAVYLVAGLVVLVRTLRSPSSRSRASVAHGTRETDADAGLGGAAALRVRRGT
jgi:cytochrome c oxidase assembly factor CtaG